MNNQLNHYISIESDFFKVKSNLLTKNKPAF